MSDAPAQRAEVVHVSGAVDSATRAALIEVVHSDDALKLRLARVVNASLDYLEEALHVAPDPQKLVIARAIVPTVIRELREEQKDQTIEELKADIAALHDDIRRQIESSATDAESWEIDDAVPVDSPLT